jgi:3-hydroxybutyryl-CoA dehydratase
MNYARPHERFSARLSLLPSAVSAFAHAVGDENPLHHDADFAARTRFKRPLASGTQTTAHLMGLAATHFAKRGAMLGLEFWFRFKKPVYADETIDLEWLVVSVKQTSRRDGEIVDLRGRCVTNMARQPWARKAGFLSPRIYDARA